MRLHRLSIEAFGPFAEAVEVDFDALGESGLFLVHGPTGSGKTSLLDAICFGLYGSVPGARREARSALRSHHAAPDAVPRVVLEFTASGRRFRIERSPEFMRPRRRGEGTTKVQAKVVMTERVDGRWVDVGNGRHDDVALVIDDVVGLGLAQFQTVVLLPQGDFAHFLRADTTARADILARLFDTSRFDDVQAWLEGRRRETDAAVKGHEDRLRLALARATDALQAVPEQAPSQAPVQQAIAIPGLDPQDEPAAPAGDDLTRLADIIDPDLAGDDDALRAALTTAGDRLRGTLAATTERAAATHSALAVARRRRERGESVARTLTNAARARSTVDQLAAQQATVTAAEQALTDAARAASVSGHLAAVDAAEREVERAATAVRALPPHLADATDAQQVVAALAAHDELVARTGELGRRRVTAARAIEGLDRDAATARTVLARAEAGVQAEEEQRGAAQARLDAALVPASRLDAARWLVDRLDRVADALGACSRADSAVDSATSRAERTRTVTTEAARRTAELARARADGLAAELALQLEPGEPCPVCGNPEHPAPATPGPAGSVTAEHVAAAESSLTAARTAQSDAEALLAAARATAAERRSTLGREVAAVLDDGPLAADPTDPVTALVAGRTPSELSDEQTLRTVREAARAEHQTAREATTVLAEVRPLLDDADERVAEAKEQVRLAQERVVAATSALDAAQVALAADDTDLERCLDEHRACPCTQTPESEDDIGGSLDERAMRAVLLHRRATGFAAEAVTVHTAVQRHTTAHEQARSRLRSALDETGLRDEAAARAALLPAAERDRLRALVDEHTDAMARAQAVLEQEEVIAALAGPAPDLDQLHHAEDAAAGTDAEAARQLALVRHADATFAAARGEVVAVLDELAPARREADLVREVADTVAGSGANNALRMSLTTYVLAARLAEVIRLANERLAVMTDSRYELRHTDALAARGKRSGLGLEVFDAWSGVARDTKTLSGGETFMASLALALGLGDAVRARTGGLELESLFVDEGFGTLDDTALEQVMEVLDGLRDGGRTVGIVSHVTELRARIPAQIKLIRGADGSRVEVLAAPEQV